ncbi:protein-(glutamine-N5) methyltransferase, release factor-specific [Vibrio breoganii]|uniref:peptide chain release factor N(5)-glutamine methyltransferase n=1 Tax=Vibrio breoganii TaxID=553239 RepID=UPI000C861EC4|nr:peptide chain release factor N(5)-glutamine methyltransferase [Vibrio breoganii]PML01192.1 protein-(glutamine-N5) methyltransferase, release factor-specific [Vibrio breoganii]PMM89845.1 protein-(glutamine-N5) methyltransferase, release factor-specific [Vibrio breoganii]
MSLPSIQESLVAATLLLTESGADSAKLDASVLLCHVLQKPRSYLLTWPEKALTEEQNQDFNALIVRRVSGEPVAYITGEREFWSLPLKVSPTTLIPRPDTERLVELALEKIGSEPGKGLDLGTGTGAIALALASECPHFEFIGVDIQADAQALATDNARQLGIRNARFLQGSWFEPVVNEGPFQIIVSNPPYIDEQDPHLAVGDVRFEPDSALVAKDNGLADLRHIALHATEYLAENGWLLMEHGYDQGEATRQILTEMGYDSVSTEQDYAGQDRVTLGQFKGRS